MWEQVAILVTRWPVLSRSQCMMNGCMHIIVFLAMHTVPHRLSSEPPQLFCPHHPSPTTPSNMEAGESSFAVWRFSTGYWWKERMWPRQSHGWQHTAGGGVCRQHNFMAHCELLRVHYLIVLVFTQYQILLLCQVCCHNPAPVTIKWLMSSYTQSNYKCR